MGYCNRCGDIINGSKCRKCGGKPVESLAKGAVDPKSSVVDRWQNQYANSILSGPDPVGTTSTPSKMKRNSIASFASSYNTRSPSSVQPKTCILCHKAVPLGTQLGKNDYCHECRAKISNKSSSSPASTSPTESAQIECVGCSLPVNPEQPKVQHQGRAWHKNCIRCYVCSNPLPNPTALDLHGSSRCLSCQQKQRSTSGSNSTSTRMVTSQQVSTSPTSTVGSSISSASRFSPIPRSLLNDKYGSTTSISTFGGSTSGDTLSTRKKSLDATRPRLDSQLFQQYQKSVGQQPPTSPSFNSSSPIKPTRSLSSQLSSPSLSSYNEKPRMVISSSTATTSSTQKSRQRRSSFTPDKPPSAKKTCRKCLQVLRGPRVRLPTPTGDTWYYHYDCLTCAACGDHFTESEFVGDGKDVFHLHCRTPSPPHSTSPPPLSPTTTISSGPISPSISPIPAASSSMPLQKRERRLSSPSQQPLDYRCHTCCLPIEDKCLKNGSRFFHPNCFTCFSCHEHLPSDRPFYDIQQEAHCEPCTQVIIKTGRDTSSQIWMQRTRVLPKLGGSKICPGCNKSIAVMEDTPGPRASRWHKKCLKCTGCKKQMDSGAKVIDDDAKWLVRCSDCSDKNPKPHYVR
ncbi:hypothetical protein [Absidia glauca]|uniref:LIM zinc-binding domain-containing protein n=1 Tax=Absidia glauca TaxID=4829 RepID=A0A163K8N2_ABSGL|nr:hypothetical protein [Absidia glauca]